MKRIITKLMIVIGIIPILQIGNATAAVTEVSDNIKTSWNFSANNPKKFITSDYSIKTNDEWNIQYVNIAAATDIYEHGAKFCRMQLQHSWTKWKIFIAPESCLTICRDGYYGDKCKYSTPGENSCEDQSLISIFDKNTSPAPYQEKNIEGFYNHERDTILLQIVSTGEHKVEVQPIEFYGAELNHIESINTRGESRILCAPGYKKNSQTGECERSSQCKCPSGQGFVSTSNTTCIVCDGRSGIQRSGVCKKCGNNQIFSPTVDDCINATMIPKSQMERHNGRECWMETSANEYKDCVLD